MHHFVMLGFSFGVRLHHPEHHPIWIIARSGRVYFFTCFIFGFILVSFLMVISVRSHCFAHQPSLSWRRSGASSFSINDSVDDGRLRQ